MSNNLSLHLKQCIISICIQSYITSNQKYTLVMFSILDRHMGHASPFLNLFEHARHRQTCVVAPCTNPICQLEIQLERRESDPGLVRPDNLHLSSTAPTFEGASRQTWHVFLSSCLLLSANLD